MYILKACFTFIFICISVLVTAQDSIRLVTDTIAAAPGRKAGAKLRKAREWKSDFQLSLFPGISTNGIRSASYINKISVNIFGGVSASNRYFEISPVTNVELQNTTGIQIAGLANIIGANTFVNLTYAEERTLMQAGYKVNQQGVQLSGLLNYVLNSGGGIQITGGLNAVGNDFSGIQIAGIGNAAGGYVIGFQAAGLYNIAKESVSGVQISTLSNYTDGQLSGTQLSLFNSARTISGRKSTPPTSARGMQIGLLNRSKSMHGLQIGLINFGGSMRGKQIGLINFFSRVPPQERVRAGTPIGLLNFGTSGSYFRYQFNEIYDINVEWTSGNCLNCSRIMGSNMPFDDRNQIFNQNALIVGYDTRQHVWGFGYGFVKVLYSKVSVMPHPNNRKRVITYGLKFLHLNRSTSFDHARNLLTRLNFDYGKRWKSYYVFTGISFNYFLHEMADAPGVYKIQSKTFNGGNAFRLAGMYWPGYSVGVQF